MSANVGLSFKEICDTITSFLEIYIHTILALRNVYPASTFTKRRAHGVGVYQSRHPQVREYIGEVVALIGREMGSGNVRRVTLVVKDAMSGVVKERFVLDVRVGEGLEGVEGLGEGTGSGWKEIGLPGAPTEDELGSYIRGLLIKLTALEGQLEDNQGELTFAVVVETKDDREPASNAEMNGEAVPWIPALAADTLHPKSDHSGNGAVNSTEPLLHVKSIETGIIDLRLMVQECASKRDRTT